MKEIFVSEIYLKEARIVRDLSIKISSSERKHLILTGKNGCGKTSVLVELNKYLTSIFNNHLKNRQNYINNIEKYNRQIKTIKSSNINENTEIQISQIKTNIQSQKDALAQFGNSEISFTNEHLLAEKVQDGNFIIAYFDAKRKTNLNVPSGIKKVDLKPRYDLQECANQDFIQYIVNLKADRSFARDDHENEIVEKIDNWFESFLESLRNIFESPYLELKFDRKNYNFNILEENKPPYNFNTLSDGYSAIISIVTELLLRMEAHESKNYDMQGVVLIDEIETHLHVELQKKILPFLTKFFPKLQFFVSTHSPFVLSSVSNAVVCDLESKIVTSDLSGYSYDALIESYFYSDKYSDLIKQKIYEFEVLSKREQLTLEEKFKLNELKKYFSNTPKYLSSELAVKLQDIALNSIKTGNR